MKVKVKKTVKKPVPMEYPAGTAPLQLKVPPPIPAVTISSRGVEWTGKKEDYLPLLKRKAKKYMATPTK